MASTSIVSKLISGLATSKKFDRLLKNVKVVSAGNGKAEYKFTVETEHLNGGGTLHGGMTATLADSLSTFAIATSGENKLGVTVDLSVSYIKAAKPGETLNIKTEVYKTGKTLSFARIDFYNSQGDIIATGNHTKYVGDGTN